MRTLPIILVLLTAVPTRADLFDDLANPDLAKAAAGDGVQTVTEISATQLAAASGLIPGNNSTLLIVQTREGGWTKLLVQAGLQKVGQTKHPMLLIERFVTFKPGNERTVVTQGAQTQLFAGVQFSADLGQVVPADVGGDVEIKPTDGGKFMLKPVGPAKLFVVNKKPAISAVKGPKFVMGDTFEGRYFNGSFKLAVDGRRSGTLKLEVDESNGEVTGWFYSDKGGQKYEVSGKLGAVRHQIQFTIRFPQSEEVFSGYMFTGDGKAIAGASKLRDREAGFYALRQEDGA